MTGVMCLPPIAGVLLGLFAPRVARRLPPATAVRLLTAAMLTTALATGFVLAVAGMFVLAQIPAVAALGKWSVHVLGSGRPVPMAVGCMAVVTVSALIVASLCRATSSSRDLLRAAAACRRLGPSVAGLIVVDDEEPDAYALPGFGGRVVVSTAMLRALPAPERRVLLAHEAAHLRHHHHLWVQAAELAAAANPLLRPSARAVRAAVERWADEVAAAEVGDRALAARALARAGLARAAARRTASVHPYALAAADSAVADRARALLAAAPPRRRALSGVVVALMVATLGAAVVTGRDAEVRFEAAHSAYTSIR